MTNSLYNQQLTRTYFHVRRKLRAVEPEPPKQEEVDPMAVAAEAGPPNAKNNAASNANSAKKDPTPPAPYRYCMPTHAVYTPPKPTARKPLTVSFTYDSLLFYGQSTFCSPHLLILIFRSLDLASFHRASTLLYLILFSPYWENSIHVNGPYRKWEIFRLRCKYPTSCKVYSRLTKIC